jgi:hypothetical protein
MPRSGQMLARTLLAFANIDENGTLLDETLCAFGAYLCQRVCHRMDLLCEPK